MKWSLMFAALLVLSGTVYFSWPSDNGTHVEGPAAGSEENVERRDTIAPETPNSSSSPTPLSHDSLGASRSLDPESTRPTRNPEPADEQTIANDERQVRDDAVRWTRDAYRLLFEDLGLTDDESRELFAYLVEIRVAQTWTRYRFGVEVSEEVRTSTIRSIIGETRTKEFLRLEKNLISYHETSRIEALLERSQAELTAAQRDQLFDVLVNTRVAPIAVSDLESVVRQIARMDERERHVIQVVPSFLSPQQVVYLDRQYQRCSQLRLFSLEMQSRRESQNPGLELPASYPLCSF